MGQSGSLADDTAIHRASLAPLIHAAPYSTTLHSYYLISTYPSSTPTAHNASSPTFSSFFYTHHNPSSFFFFFLNNPAPPEFSPFPLPAPFPIKPHLTWCPPPPPARQPRPHKDERAARAGPPRPRPTGS